VAQPFSRDLAFAARTLRKSPVFAVTAMITIALGIGATTAIFSVVNAVLLRPLPYDDAGRLVYVQGDLTARNLKDFPMPPGDFPDLRDQGTMFETVAALSTFRGTFGDDQGAPERIRFAQVTPNVFPLLGARATLGRAFIEADATPLPPPPQTPLGVQAPPPPPPPPALAVLSHAFWQRRFGGDPQVLGKIVRVGGGTAEIIGVLEPDFELLYPPDLGVERRPDMYFPLRIDWARASRINVFLRVLGRLKPGVSVLQAQSQVDAIVADLRRRFPIKETAGLRWRVEPMQSYLVADVKPGVLALMGAVLFVLLIACANVANLLLVRAAARERELVVRAALGASRRDLIQEMLAESVLVAGGGALLGIGLALAGIVVLRAIAPVTLPRVDLVSIDAAVLAFTIVAALASAVVFGLIPALRASRQDAGAALRSSNRTAGLAGGGKLRNAVVVAEVALSFVLLVGSGLMIRSFVALQRTDPGFDPEGVLTFIVQPVGIQEAPARAAWMQELRSRFAALPGVTAVSGANPLPLDGGVANARWGTAEAQADPSKFQQANVHTVQPGYFAAMRTTVIEGRAFDEADNTPDRTGIVIDRVLARKAFGSGSAVGQRVFVRIRSNEPEWLDVIGVVEQQRHTSLAVEGREAIFVTDGFFGHGGANHWLIRTAGDPNALAAAVRGEVARFTPASPVAELQPYSAFVDQATAPTRFALVLIGVFAGIAVVLAAVGLYGVLATAVRQRTAEIGIRMTFGADPSSIFGLVIGQGLKLSGIGIAAGIVAGLALTRLMRTLLIGVQPTDPVTFAVIALLFLLIAAAACWVPARRAASLDPNAALREE
jgi:putative ABC transport system permease protein